MTKNPINAPGPSELLETTNCNYCGGKNFLPLFSGTERRQTLVPDNVWCVVVRCTDCGLLFLQTRVKEEYIHLWYPKKDYYISYTVKSAQRKIELIKWDLYRLIAKKYFGYPTNNIHLESGISTALLGFLVPLMCRLFSFRFRRILPYISGGKVLDFGFGDGTFILRMKDLGWESWGVERDSGILEAMTRNGIRAYHDLNSSEIPDNYFDWVTTYHSIEHVYNPKSVFRKMFEILKPGGNIYIGVPNFNSLVGRLFRTYWDNLGVPLHSYVFTVESAKMYLKNAGFTEISVVYKSLPQGITGSIQYAVNANVSRIIGKTFHSVKIRNSIFLGFLVSPLTKMIDLFHFGDCIELTARKP